MSLNITIERDDANNRWIARFPFSYQTKDIVKAAGFRFDGIRKLWWTADEAIATKLAHPDVVAKLNEEKELAHKKAQAAIEASHAVVADIHVPAPKGLSYLGYQVAGIAYALERFGFDFSLAQTQNGNRQR